MKKRFKRQPEWKKVYFKKGKNIISENYITFSKKYKSHAIIKILRSDFKLIKKNMTRFTHFNAQNTIHKPGKNYLIFKIYKKGYFDGSTNKQPILYYNNFILAKCLSSQNDVDYADLKEKVFKHSLSNIRNVDSLKKAIKKRYDKTFVYLSNMKKLSLGVAITELKIIKRF